ncbi:SsrA-binding protein SmpB [Candidatus Haliotispira prima]|uniref:SsrA-binding protein n=1 Tax=Candidatus Haliotispira prima TaxID=3034016 RepID=A0ABY8MGY8_9SPIO|nr:SsrA-binding protein SmpB [Candidatus Haliotispira prima]
MAKKKISGVVADNRKARFEYSLEDALECGIELKGTEVKSLRAAQVAFRDSFCSIEKGELWLHNLHISPYPFATHFNHQPERKRKLLANRKQIDGLHRRVKEKGYSLIPVKVYFNGSLVKIEIALAKGKKLYDKRHSIRDRDIQRDEGRKVRMK